LATLPIEDSNVKRAPIFTTAGLEVRFLLYPVVESSKQMRNTQQPNLIESISIQ
jgi:hypothetical protein